MLTPGTRASTLSRTSPSRPWTTALFTFIQISGVTITPGGMSGSCNTTLRAKQRASPSSSKSTGRPTLRTTRRSANLGSRRRSRVPVSPTTPSGSSGRLCPSTLLIIMPSTTTRRRAVITMFWRTSTRLPCWQRLQLPRSEDD